jgi:hypothetical protein
LVKKAGQCVARSPSWQRNERGRIELLVLKPALDAAPNFSGAPGSVVRRDIFGIDFPYVGAEFSQRGLVGAEIKRGYIDKPTLSFLEWYRERCPESAYVARENGFRVRDS